MWTGRERLAWLPAAWVPVAWVLAIAALLPLANAPAGAQSPYGSPGTAVPGASPGLAPARPPVIIGSQDSGIMRHRDAAGRPCLTVGGFPRAHTVNTNLFDHVIDVSNTCAQIIKLQVCYYRSQDCIQVEVQGRARKEAILGVLPAIKDFRYEFRERF